MKLGKLSLIAATAAVMLCLQSGSVWAIRAVGITVTGQITASPSPTQIEIAHHLYQIEPTVPRQTRLDPSSSGRRWTQFSPIREPTPRPRLFHWFLHQGD